MRSSFYRLVPALFLTAVIPGVPALAQESPPTPAPPAEQKPAAPPAAPAEPKTAEPCTGEVAACVQQIVEKLKKRGWIGMDVALNPDTRLPEIGAVTPGSPADKGGLKAGDVLLGQNGVPYDSKKGENLEAVEAPHRQLAPGDTVTYLVRRGGKEMELDVRLVEAPEDVLATWLGLTLYADYYQGTPAKTARPAAAAPAPKPGPRRDDSTP